jgi:hypothetical protein
MPKASIYYPSTIVDRNGNGGWHKNGKRAYRNAVTKIYECLQTYKEPRLYHLCFEELEDDVPNKTDNAPHKTNMAMLNALVQMAEREGIRCEWFAAREQADATKKDHLHCFMIIDAHGIKVAKLFNQFEDGRVQQFCKARGVKFAIFSPKDYNAIHGRNTYMALPYQGQGNRQTPLGTERLNDALVWLTYNYKARSKPTDDSEGQIFPASRPSRMPKPASTIPAPTLTKEQHEEQPQAQAEASASSEANSPTATEGPAHKRHGSAGYTHGRAEEFSQNTCRASKDHRPEAITSREPPSPIDRLPVGKGSSEVVPYDPPLKWLSYLAQKILDRPYELGHNSFTIFCTSGDPA